jgi:rhodanese-related sulfurtransferase
MSVSVFRAEKLLDAGFKDVYISDGECSAWVEAGYEIEK